MRAFMSGAMLRPRGISGACILLSGGFVQPLFGIDFVARCARKDNSLGIWADKNPGWLGACAVRRRDLLRRDAVRARGAGRAAPKC